MSWIGDLLSGIWVDEDNAARARAADAKNRELNDAYRQAGDWTEEQWRASEERFDQQPGEAEQMDAAFREGWREGYEDMTGGIKDTLNAPARFLWNSLPWWLILVLVLVVLHYTGLLGPLLGRVRRAAA